MMTISPRMSKRLRVAGVLVVVGLLVELTTLHWSHPTAFLFFLFLGGSLMGLGILLYLYSIISGDESKV
ncbi:MAG: hypothetical protein JST84_17565 [Acidobacteria bacterium]|nr:hypothetical protein [Acidobacteriota bacterium]